MDSALYIRPYSPDRNGSIALPRDVRWQLFPRYVGLRENNTHLIDERITLVLDDALYHFWPVIVKMSIAEAEQLHARLAEVIAQRQHADGTA
jgi:hypothetical protein